jgi:polysaccharide export outer membrane protein
MLNTKTKNLSRSISFWLKEGLLLAAACLSCFAQDTTTPSKATAEQPQAVGAAVPTNKTDAPLNANAPPRPSIQERNPRYQLTPGDAFDLDFRFQPEFNQSLSVQPDGFVALRDIGDVQVGGLTVPQLSSLLEQKYAGILNRPVITVVLKDFEKPHIMVGGEVTRPGRFDLRSDVTVSEAVQLAGGFTPAAKHSQVYLFRKVSSEWMEVKKVDVKAMLAKGDLREDVHLRPGDMLYVPKNTLSKIGAFIPRTSVGTMFNPLHY